MNGNTPKSKDGTEILFPMNTGSKLDEINLDDTLSAAKLYQFEDEVQPSLTRRQQSLF